MAKSSTTPSKDDPTTDEPQVDAKKTASNEAKPKASAKTNAPKLTASDILQRRMGLGKLIADRLVTKLPKDDQQALVAAHEGQDFAEYSRLVAMLHLPRKPEN